jgi:hypothetical protein
LLLQIRLERANPADRAKAREESVSRFFQSSSFGQLFFAAVCMSENVNEETPVWVEETQMTLGSIVHRPKLTTKLLMKPPFRFIHDVILETVRVTGFPGLSIQSDEFDSSNFTVFKPSALLKFPLGTTFQSAFPGADHRWSQQSTWRACG